MDESLLYVDEGLLHQDKINFSAIIPYFKRMKAYFTWMKT